ncbi:MAG: leucine-rich repeat protein [Bacilli bacterium]|nr:leucine-rich repeat protein [Bacilli bacterium]
MKARICTRCGESLREKHGELSCPYCGATYSVEDEQKTLEEMLEEHKRAIWATRKRILWDEIHKKFPSKNAIVSAARSVLESYDEDLLARFFLAVHDSDPNAVISFLSSPKSSFDLVSAREIAAIMVKSLEPTNMLAFKTFVENNFEGEEYVSLMNQIEKETEKIEDGTYVTNLPRDIFLAYSSLDMDQVVEMDRYLEDAGFSVFCALKNLRKGKGAAERYEAALQDAMKHCRVFVFLSSHNSRRLNCDAISKEIPFVLDHLPEMERIHFRLDESGEIKQAVAIYLKEFDDGREWCRDKDDLVARIVAMKRKDASKAAAPTRGKKQAEPEKEQEEEPVSNYIATLHPGMDGVRFSGKTLVSYEGDERRVLIGPEFNEITRGAFKSAKGVEEIDTGSSVRILEEFSFDSIPSLKRLIIGPAVGEIRGGVFTRTPALEEIVVDKRNRDFKTVGGALLSADETRIYRYPPQQKGDRYAVPRKTRVIEVGAFSGAQYLETVEFPDGLREIRNGAFVQCPKLRTVFIPLSVETMGKHVFSECPKLHIDVEAKSYPSGWDSTYNGQAFASFGKRR